MVLTAEEKRERRRAYDRRRYAEKKTQESLTDDLGPVTEDIPAIEVSEPSTKPKQSLKERLMGKVKQPVPNTKGKRAKKIDSNLLGQLAPTLCSTLVVTFSRNMLPDPYKVCAPAQDEALAMVAPYFNILSRYIEITGQASENTLDLINALLASIMYGIRAYVTYTQIKEAEKHHESLEQFHTRKHAEYVASLNKEQEEINAAIANSTETSRRGGYSRAQATIAIHDIVSDSDGDSEYIRREADKVAVLLARDVAGRKQLGLV